MNRVIIISELYYPEENATGYFLTGIAEGLARENELHVSVLCAQPSYNQRGQRASKKEERRGVSIHRCRSTTFDPRGALGRLMNFATTSLSIGWRALFSIRKGDKVLVVTNPPSLPFFIRFACWLRRAKFVLLVHDVYPEVFVPLGMLRPENPLYRGMSRATGWLYGSSHAVVALGEDMARLISEKSRQKARVSVIPNWGDVEEIRPEKRAENKLLREMGLLDAFVVHYSGNHGRTHDLEILIEAADQLRDHVDIRFLFIGEGSGKAAAVGLASERGLSNVSFRTFVARTELNTALNASDLSVVTFKPGMAGISVPSRVYNLLAAGKPILAVVDQNSEVANVIREGDAGMVVPPESPRLLAEQIIALKSNPLALARMAANARKEAETKYSYEVARQRYRELFDSL